MNLFTNETKEELSKYTTEDWAEVLSQYLDISSFNAIKAKIGELRKKSIIYPEPNDIFKAFRYNFSKVKVVIIGQDPYHNGNADGLAFSCKQSLSPSLLQIIQAIWYEEFKDSNNLDNSNSIMLNMKRYMDNKNNWNLEYLAQQGVMLFNPTLTVESGKAGSHKGIWNNFTNAVIQSLSNKKELVWICWGNDAKESIKNVKGHYYFLYNEHPAAASYRKDVWKCDHFSKCNEFLRSKNLTEIEWLQR